MSTRKVVIKFLLAAETQPTNEELLTATGVAQRILTDTISQLKRDGIVSSVPETFFVSDAGHAVLRKQARNESARKARVLLARRARSLERRRAKRAEEKRARDALRPVPPPAPAFVVPMSAPSSVFDLARAMGVAA